VDLKEELDDPVDPLFGVQLGGGADIDRVLAYSAVGAATGGTVLVLLSDLFEGGNRADMLRRACTLVACGVQMVVLLALNE